MLPYFNQKALEIIGRKYESNKNRVQEIVGEAIKSGALEDEPFVQLDNFQVILSEIENGRHCYLCNRKEEGGRWKLQILHPDERTEEYEIHKFHFA